MIDDFGLKQKPGPADEEQLDTNTKPTDKSLVPKPNWSRDYSSMETLELPETATPDTPPKRFSHHSLKAWFQGLSKKQRLAAVAGVLLAIILLGAGIGFALRTDTAPVVATTATKRVAAPPKPTTEASSLTGLQVEPAINKRQVTGVMIENSTAARPQSGLDKAGIVFEAIAEGGITRFLALFQDSDPEYIGPVRSVRPYYIQWCMGFDCALAHVGGSPEALANIKSWGTKDLDQYFGGGYFNRSSSRPSPHNMYTSINQLRSYQDAKGYTSSNFTGLLRASDDEKVTTSAVPATAVSVNPSSAQYASSYNYDSSAKVYKRTMAGQPHMQTDKAGAQTQIAPKVVITMVVPYSIASDGKHSVYGVEGSGEAFIFQNGVRLKGTWTKSSSLAQLSFLDETGQTVLLAPGQTWITAIASNGMLTYQ